MQRDSENINSTFTSTPHLPSTGLIVGLLTAIQFTNVFDFMMVMPLGPDFARALKIPNEHLGWIGGSYTMAASIAGLVGALFLDRFDRRKALFYSMLGLSLGTLLGGVSSDVKTLLLSRIIAGMFGGPATSLCLSIIADIIPVEKRGKAFSWVMAAFSIASVFGVPVGLECARLWGWRAPFFLIGFTGLVITFLSISILPAMRGHLLTMRKGESVIAELMDIVRQKEAQLAWTGTALAMVGSFCLVPNFSTYFQMNLGYPRESLGLLYLVGGTLSFLILRIAGPAIDRYGSVVVGVIASVVLIAVTFSGYLIFPPWIPVAVIFTGFMMGNSVRMVSYNALTSQIPLPHLRARFMSLQSAIQHLFAALGAFVSSMILVTNEQGALVHFNRLAMIFLVTALIFPVILKLLDKKIHQNGTATLVADSDMESMI
jgi:predicted MFS family arabinose efflux permease